MIFNIKQIVIYLLFLLFICNINYCSGETVLLNYNITSYESVANSVNGCSLIFGVVFKDNYKIKSFGSNIKTRYDGVDFNVLLEDGDLHLYQLKMINIPLGISNQLSFNVTNSNDEVTLLKINKSFNCQKLLLPIEFDYFTTNYTLDSLFSYYIFFAVKEPKFSSNLDISESLTCKLSFSGKCSVSRGFKDYQIYSYSFNTSNRGELLKPKLQLTLYDIYGGEQVILFNNSIIDYAGPSTEIESVQLSLPNNSIVNTELESKVIGMKVSYKVLNSIPVLNVGGYVSIYSFKNGYFITGSPDRTIYYFPFTISEYQSTKVIYDEFPNGGNINNSIQLLYSTSTSLVSFLTLDPSYKLIFEESLNTFIFETNISVPYLRNDFVCSTVRVYYDNKNIVLPYPYGITRNISNSRYYYTTESLMHFANLESEQYIIYYSFNKIIDIPIPTNYPGIALDDKEPPMMFSITNELLENNKILTTLNISDANSGVYKVYGIQPLFESFAPECLVSGDTNNGIYQILSNSEDIIYLLNTPSIQFYDRFGNTGYYSSDVYYNFNFDQPPRIIESIITESDITFFEFDRHEIDTSFNELDLELRVAFKGGNEVSAVPKITLNYDSVMKSKDADLVFKGVYNKTSQLFEIKIKVPAREIGELQYTLNIPPFAIENDNLAKLFPNQIVKLSTNYIDRCPPTIKNLKSLTDTQLFIPRGQYIEIGWLMEIYDYPVGLDRAEIQVVSNIDFEPFNFVFRPNNSVPGSDILSNYTISLQVKPVENQTYYISSLKLYDKNGYYSIYPQQDYVISFDAFFDNKFLSERNIKVNITQDQDPSYTFDNQAPELLDFSFPSSFDSFGINRTAICKFSIKDIGNSNISKRHNPYIFIQFLYSNYLRVQSELINIDNETQIHYYSAIINFDYASLYYGALISIHGITDNSLNVASFTSQRLKERGFNSTISNPVQTKPPVILDFSTVNENGGKFYIYGKQFRESPMVYMDSGNGFKVIPTLYKSNLAITASVPNVKGIKSIQFKVVSNGISSNSIQVAPTINSIDQSSNCSQFNECNGKGTCVNSKCVCNQGSEGPDCLSTTKLVENKPKDNTPSFSSFNSMIEIYSLEEINILGKVVKSYNLDSWYGSTEKSQYHSSNAYRYTHTLKDTSTNISIIVDIFDSPVSITFGTNKLQMDKGSIKYTISFNSYPFESRFSTLQLKLNASISIEDSKCKLNSIGLSQNSDNIEWIKLRSDNQSIYGKFIQNAVIDYRLMSINNKLLVSPSNENQLAVIGIQIPYFFETAVLDPDFSVLFDVDNLAKNKESSCYVGETESDEDSNSKNLNNSNGGLSNSKIIIISVVCGFVAISVFIASIILINKKRKVLIFKKKLANL